MCRCGRPNELKLGNVGGHGREHSRKRQELLSRGLDGQNVLTMRRLL